MRRLSAWIAFSAEGAELTAFRDALRAAHYPLTAQQMRGGALYARARARHWFGITQTAAAHGIRLTLLRRRGLRFRLRPYRLRFGLLCGLLLGTALFIWCNCFVRSIEIYGNTNISDAEILCALEELGVRRGTAVSRIPFTYVERRMRLAVRGIEWIALRHTGGRLIVDLTEERNPPEMVRDRVPCNYIAAVDAQITDIRVLGGQAVRQTGDTVRAGDLILSGAVEDKFGTTRYYHADGIVTGIYGTDFTAEQPFCSEITVTGGTGTRHVLEVFGKRLPLPFQPDPPAGTVIYGEVRHPLTLFGLRLPFSRIDCCYTESRTALTEWSADEARALLREAAARYEQNFHAADRILSRSESFTETDLGISLKIHYEIEGIIGKTSEIFVK
ncbi:MAG: sporulation protein YqfD [Oscillospiraceae bacterium]|nr:sporulation protein YqfD [Oscillospiraceae bacterium]